MTDGTTSMQQRRLTFSDVMSTNWLMFSLSWRMLVVSLKAWWRGGGTVSFQAIQRQSVRDAIASGSVTLTMETPTQTATVNVTVTPA